MGRSLSKRAMGGLSAHEASPKWADKLSMARSPECGAQERSQ